MSELAQLSLIFTALYLFECVAWVPRRAFFFVALLGRVRARAVLRPNPGWSVGAALGVPWPPLAPMFVAEPLPLGFGSGSLWLLPGEPGAGRCWRWAELAPVRAEGERVLAGGEALCTGASKRGAAALARGLEDARVVDEEARAGRLEQLLAEHLGAGEVGDEWRAFGHETRVLRVALVVLWLALFGGLAVLLATRALLLALPVAALVLAGWVGGAWLLRRTLRRCAWLPRPCWPDRTRRLVALLSPLALLRGCDLLARERFGDRDPLAVAAGLADAATLVALARPRLAMLESPAPVPDVPAADLAWYRATAKKHLESLLATRGQAAADVLAIPARQDDASVAYCPACLAQYPESIAAGGRCERAACAAVALVRY